jgi:4-hydroxy-3-polyprenylbenzoate decarboxylase
MHAFWGVGQMSFVKHAIFVNQDAPQLHDDEAITKWILDRLDIQNILISHGVVDALDHSSPKFALGGKLGIDCTNEPLSSSKKIILEDEVLLQKMQKISADIKELRQYFKDTNTPICIISVDKKDSQLKLIDQLKVLFDNIKVLIIVDQLKNDLDNAYMLVWRVVNNIDARRDIIISNDTICVDATNKSIVDGFERRWPDDVDCTKEVLQTLKDKKVIDIDDEFEKRFYL